MNAAKKTEQSSMSAARTPTLLSVELRAQANAHCALYEQWHDSPSVDGSDCKEMLSLADLLDAAADSYDAHLARIAELEAALERIAGIGEWTNNPVEVAHAALAKGQA